MYATVEESYPVVANVAPIVVAVRAANFCRAGPIHGREVSALTAVAAALTPISVHTVVALDFTCMPSLVDCSVP